MTDRPERLKLEVAELSEDIKQMKVGVRLLSCGTYVLISLHFLFRKRVVQVAQRKR